MSYAALNSDSSTPRQILTAAISSTFGVSKSQVQLSVVAPSGKHRRSLQQDATALALPQGSRGSMSNVDVKITSVVFDARVVNNCCRNMLCMSFVTGDSQTLFH
jgi:hypothetical protein